MQTELRPVEGYLENVLDFLQHSDIIRSCLIELNISEKKTRHTTPFDSSRKGRALLQLNQLQCKLRKVVYLGNLLVNFAAVSSITGAKNQSNLEVPI